MRRLTTALVLGVLAASGAYALIYLFRWEWHRAIITALFFVAAEVALGISMLLRRIARLEERIEALASTPTHTRGAELDPAVLARIQEAAPPSSKPFAWLDPKQSQLSVFLPFLLGVGALASGLAWVVEQLARRTTTPALERGLARRLAPLALPQGGLLGPAPVHATADHRRPLWLSAALPVAAGVVVLTLAVAGIGWLGDALQTRPDVNRSDVATRIDVELRGARSIARPEQVAATLWGTCSHTLHGTVPTPTIMATGGGRIQVMVDADVGSHAEERLRGCLEDTVVDRVQATVLALEPIAAR